MDKKRKIGTVIVLIIVAIGVYFFGKSQNWWSSNKGSSTDTGGTGTGANTGTGTSSQTGTGTGVASEKISEVETAEKKKACDQIHIDIKNAQAQADKSKVVAQNLLNQLGPWQNKLQVQFGNYADSSRCPITSSSCKTVVNKYNVSVNAYLNDVKNLNALITKCQKMNCPNCK